MILYMYVCVNAVLSKLLFSPDDLTLDTFRLSRSSPIRHHLRRLASALRRHGGGDRDPGDRRVTAHRGPRADRHIWSLHEMSDYKHLSTTLILALISFKNDINLTMNTFLQ